MRNDQLEKVFLSFGEVKRKRKKKKQKKNLDNLKNDDMVKLALLFFLEHVLLGKEGKILIDMEWVSLVDCLKFLISIHGAGFVIKERFLG